MPHCLILAVLSSTNDVPKLAGRQEDMLDMWTISAFSGVLFQRDNPIQHNLIVRRIRVHSLESKGEKSQSKKARKPIVEISLILLTK